MRGESRRWGWHHLTDQWAARIVADANIARGQLVLDIGAGTGMLTAYLVAVGARVIAIELHPDRVAALRRRFADAPVTIVRADASDLRLPRRPFRVVANPPFSVNAAIMRRLLAPGSRMIAADIVLPRHVAQSFAAGRTAGAGRWSLAYEAFIGRGLPPQAFVPAPPNPTAVLVLRRRRR